MNEILHLVKDNLISYNDIFDNNGFVYENDFQFMNGGVSDRYDNLFYIRYPEFGKEKFVAKKMNDNIYEVRSKIRIVFQLSTDVNKTIAISGLLAQLSSMEELEILSYTDESEYIYKTEFNNQQSSRRFYLFMVDAKASKIKSFSYCKPICKTGC